MLSLSSPLVKVEGLERFVQEASSHVDRRLIDILFNKFDLAKHCDAMRRYVLLGQGDFVQALMDMVGGLPVMLGLGPTSWLILHNLPISPSPL